MGPQPALSKLALIFLISAIVPSASALVAALSVAEVLGVLQGRQASTCPGSSVRCSDSKLPPNFCCPSDATCISLDSSSSALCCPKGADCSKIQPISCDLSLQDVSGVPDAAIKTTRLKDKQQSCGINTCCPFGYSCDNDSQCVINKATSSTGATTTSASTSSTSTTSTTKPSATGIDSTKPAAAENTPLCPRFPGGAVAAGFFPGMLVGAVMALIGVICLGRRHREEDRPYSKDSGWSSLHKHSNSYTRGRKAGGTITGISGPIPMQGGARTEFLRREPSTMFRNGAHRAQSWFSSRSSPRFHDGADKNAALNPTNHWKMPTPPAPSHVPMNAVGKSVPVTPPSQIRPYANTSIQREPSTESIKVFSPPSMVQPPSRSGFSPSSSLEQQPPQRSSSGSGLKNTIMGKLSPKFKSIVSPRMNHLAYNSNFHDGPRAGALDPAPPAQSESNQDNNSPLRRPSSPTLPSAENTPQQQSDTTHILPSTQYQPNPPSSFSSPDHTFNFNAPPTSYPTGHADLNVHPSQRGHQPSLSVPHDESRPLTHMTTFTDVLRDAGLERSEMHDPSRPDVPAIPKGLDWGGAKKGKRDKSRERERGKTGGKGNGNGKGGKTGPAFI